MVHLEVHLVWTSSHLGLGPYLPALLLTLAWEWPPTQAWKSALSSTMPYTFPALDFATTFNKFGKVIHIPAGLPYHLLSTSWWQESADRRVQPFSNYFNVISSWFTAFPLTTVTRGCSEAPGFSLHWTLIQPQDDLFGISFYFVSATTDVDDVISSWFLPVIPSCQATGIVFLLFLFFDLSQTEAKVSWKATILHVDRAVLFPGIRGNMMPFCIGRHCELQYPLQDLALHPYLFVCFCLGSLDQG